MDTTPRQRLLTFNAHEAYLHLFAKIDLPIDIIHDSARGVRPWNRASRPLPANCRLIDFDQALARIAAADYDCVICHTLSDLMGLQVDIKKILIFHMSVSGRILVEKAKTPPDEIRRAVRSYLTYRQVTPVFISSFKVRDWDIPGIVIDQAVDPNDYGGYGGGVQRCLVVGNQIRQRRETFGYELIEAVQRSVPTSIVGRNPDLKTATEASSWDDLKQFYRSHAVFLSTLQAGVEDGYNMALLEAMATGMPIVTTPHPTSPIVDGVNGLVRESRAELISAVQGLIDQPEIARCLGAQARKTVEEKFSVARFCFRWRSLLQSMGEAAWREPVSTHSEKLSDADLTARN